MVRVPQVRDAPEAYRSGLMTFLRGHSDVLERLTVEMYARGLSTRDIEDALQKATGDRLLSRTAVSQLTEVLWAKYEAFSERDLSTFEVEYVFLDAVYESLRHQGGGKEGLLCAWALCADGTLRTYTVATQPWTSLTWWSLDTNIRFAPLALPRNVVGSPVSKMLCYHQCPEANLDPCRGTFRTANT